MKAFTTHTGIVVPMDRPNVDTDAIIPKQFLKSIKRTGFGPNLFDEWRYLDHGEPGMSEDERQPDPEFVLNFDRYQGASILLARENFGCGSSREHAPWALEDYGIRAIIAPSYADIFYNNCFKNGVLPIVLEEKYVSSLFAAVEGLVGYELTIDLHAQTIHHDNGTPYTFEVDAFKKERLLRGLDDIGMTLQLEDKIKAYEAQRKEKKAWLYPL